METEEVMSEIDKMILKQEHEIFTKNTENNMPRFLEQKLKKEYGDNPHAIFGTLNKIGAMRGNRETSKGRKMEKKHEAKERALAKAKK